MAITINGSGTVTGLSVGGLPDGTVDADTLATDSVTAVKIPDTVEADLKSGRKNLIINGGMQVAQRGTSETGVTSSGYKTCDRFIFSRNIGTWTIDQSTDAPDGFSNSLKMTCTTTETPGISSEVGFMYYPEAQDLQHLNYGSSSAKKITISFWVKCSETGDFVLEVLQNDSLRHIGHLVTINSADTWEYKTVTFDGDTSGTINNDNGQGLTIKWWTFIASETYQATGSLQTSWGALDQGGRGYGQTINILDATSDYFAITGVQLEVGSQATDFEHRSYGEELALCQRYYWKTDLIAYKAYAVVAFYSTTAAYGKAQHPVKMRAAPSISNSGSFEVLSASSNLSANLAHSYITSDGWTLRGTNVTGATAGYAGWIRNNNDATAYIECDAEL